MAKRRRFSKEKNVYDGKRVMEVLKLLLFYGFKRMCDIVTLSRMSKTLDTYAKTHVYFKVASQTFVKKGFQKPEIICCSTHLPTVALLRANNKILIFFTQFGSPCELSRIRAVNYSAYSNLCCHLLLSYDADLQFPMFYQLFQNPSSHIVPSMTFIFTDEKKTQVKGIELYASM